MFPICAASWDWQHIVNSLLITITAPLRELTNRDRDDNKRIVAYASRSLSKVEQRYSQTEKKALGVFFGCEKFHMYLIGIEFELDTDHKPLEVIYHPKAKPSACIERWALRLQQCQFKLRHRPEKTNPADVLSRKPLSTLEKNSIAEDYVNFLTVIRACISASF
jgi:hypothetical protein